MKREGRDLFFKAANDFFYEKFGESFMETQTAPTFEGLPWRGYVPTALSLGGGLAGGYFGGPAGAATGSGLGSLAGQYLVGKPIDVTEVGASAALGGTAGLLGRAGRAALAGRAATQVGTEAGRAATQVGTEAGTEAAAAAPSLFRLAISTGLGTWPGRMAAGLPLLVGSMYGVGKATPYALKDITEAWKEQSRPIARNLVESSFEGLKGTAAPFLEAAGEAVRGLGAGIQRGWDRGKSWWSEPESQRPQAAPTVQPQPATMPTQAPNVRPSYPIQGSVGYPTGQAQPLPYSPTQPGALRTRAKAVAIPGTSDDTFNI